MIAVQQTCSTRGGKITIDRVITGPENRFMRNKEMCRVRAVGGGGKFNFKGSATQHREAISQLILITTDPYMPIFATVIIFLLLVIVFPIIIFPSYRHYPALQLVVHYYHAFNKIIEKGCARGDNAKFCNNIVLDVMLFSFFYNGDMV